MPAREDVNIRVSANIAEAIRMWKALEDGPKGMAHELEAMGKKGKAAAAGMGAEFENLIGRWASIAGGIGVATKALEAYRASQEALLRTTGDSTLSADSMSRQLFLLTDGQRALKTIREDMLRMSERRGAAPAMTKDVMASLLGSGYSYEQVMGGAGDVVLQTLAATNAMGKGVDAKSLVDALTAHLEATGQGKTAANLAGAGVAAQGQFAATKLELADLQALAPRAKNIFDITGLRNEQIALMSQFKDVTTADVGATAMHTAFQRLQRPRMQGQAALKEMGVRPEDVDFVGEDYFQVAERLAAGFNRAGGRGGALKQMLFGSEGLLAGNVLFTDKGIAQTRERLQLSGDRGAFNRAAGVTEGGYQAQRNRADAREMMAYTTEGFIDPETARKELLTRIQASGASGVTRAVTEKAFDAYLWATNSPEVAIRGAVRMGGASARTADEIINASRSSPVEVTVKLVDQNEVSIPHKSTVHGVSKPNRATPKGR